MSVLRGVCQPYDQDCHQTFLLPGFSDAFFAQSQREPLSKALRSQASFSMYGVSPLSPTCTTKPWDGASPVMNPGSVPHRAGCLALKLFLLFWTLATIILLQYRGTQEPFVLFSQRESPLVKLMPFGGHFQHCRCTCTILQLSCHLYNASVHITLPVEERLCHRWPRRNFLPFRKHS